MIADTLSQTVADIARYLNDPTFNATYSEEVRERLVGLCDEADAIRADLDMPPDEIPAPVQDNLIRRGWSKGLIDRLLGGPDWTTRNPHGDNFAPMLCWRQDRVLVAEETPEFQEHRSRKSGSVGSQQ